MAVRNGFRVLRVNTEDHAWDFGSRAAFAAFCAVGCVEWTRRLPEAERPEFINDVLNRYRAVAADGSGEENTFKFYQMDISLLALMPLRGGPSKKEIRAAIKKTAKDYRKTLRKLA